MNDLDLNNGLFVDGGLVGRNPSPIGGCFAWCFVDGGKIVKTRTGRVFPTATSPVITNNQTEMVAMLQGILELPDSYEGSIFSDSMITIGRVSMNWAWQNIDKEQVRQFDALRVIRDFKKMRFVLLDGHPTRAELQAGIGKKGHPVSYFNVLCDRECQKISKEWKREMSSVPQLA